MHSVLIWYRIECILFTECIYIYIQNVSYEPYGNHNHNSIIDTHTNRRFKHNTKNSHLITRKENRIRKYISLLSTQIHYQQLLEM